MNELRELYDYNRWANARIIAACTAVPDEVMARDMGSSFPSVLATLAHILSAEWIWLERWNGRSPAGVPADWDLSGLAAIRAIWAGVEAGQAAFLRDLDEQRLRTHVDYRNTRGEAHAAPLWQLMRHVVNHSTYHRGQIVTLLRQLGFPAVATDMVLYHREIAASVAAPEPAR
jgi:uncharacterized damage-inducible protein DinB